MRRAAWAVLAGAIACGAWHVVASARPSEAPPAHRALLVSVDGLRPDVLLRADAPVIRGLMARGSFSMWARTVDVAVTLPAHASMVTGTSPDHHGIVWNGDPPPGAITVPRRSTLLALAHRAGLTTAFAAGKTKFHVLVEPGACDHAYVPRDSTMPDDVVADSAAAWVMGSAPQVMFLHLPGPDVAAHAHGWGSPEQLAAVAVADRALGRVLAALARRGVLDSTLVLITADHGGVGRRHGAGDVRSLEIPWILCGPGVRAGVDLDSEGVPMIRTEDSVATLAAALGLVPDVPFDGHPVTAAFRVPPR